MPKPTPKNKEIIEVTDYKLRIKQRVLFRAFAINILLILIVWLLTFSPAFMGWVAFVLGYSIPATYISLINWIAIWDIAGAVLFLIPGLAIWWERCMNRK